jgi:hypothetical protein
LRAIDLCAAVSDSEWRDATSVPTPGVANPAN